MTSGAAPARKPNGRSRERLGADHARLWVRKITLRNPAAKAVLMAAANYMNEDGAAWPGISTLAQDTDLSEDTVISRLRWCESIGIIALFKTWVDEHGQRNHEGRGRITSSEIRFIIDADIDTIEANAAGHAPVRALRGAAKGSHEDKAARDALAPATVESKPQGLDEIGTRHGREQNPVSTGLAQGQPSTAAARIEELEPEDNPPTPQGGCEGEPSVDEENKIEGWQEFKTTFEGDGNPIIRVSIALTLFAALTDPERKLATRAAAGLVEKRSRERRPGAKPSAQTFLRERDAWPAFARLAPPEPVAKLKIARGSTEYQAATVYWLLVARVPLQSSEADLPQKLVTSPAFLALAQFAETPREQWIALDADRHDDKAKIGAWRERIKDWSGRWPELEQVPVLDETGAPKVIVKEHTTGSGETMNLKFPVTQEGLRVPAAWPPRQDGSWPESHFAKTG